MNVEVGVRRLILRREGGVPAWDVSNVVQGNWSFVRQPQVPVRIAAALGLALSDVWPPEAGALPGVQEAHVRFRTLGVGFDVPAPLTREDDDLRELRAKFALLPAREQRVLAMRYGLDGPEMGVNSVGAVLGRSRQCVYRIECRALEQLRRLLCVPVSGSSDPDARLAHGCEVPRQDPRCRVLQKAESPSSDGHPSASELKFASYANGTGRSASRCRFPRGRRTTSTSGRRLTVAVLRTSTSVVGSTRMSSREHAELKRKGLTGPDAALSETSKKLKLRRASSAKSVKKGKAP
ncbi:MAG: hypothetical protein IPJ77_11225 [Planctomycetes bacterium]|nr:hypothetical protein [Planctomycetota bacterium]